MVDPLCFIFVSSLFHLLFSSLLNKWCQPLDPDLFFFNGNPASLRGTKAFLDTLLIREPHNPKPCPIADSRPNHLTNDTINTHPLLEHEILRSDVFTEIEDKYSSVLVGVRDSGRVGQ